MFAIIKHSYIFMQVNSVIPIVLPTDPYNSDMAGRPPSKTAPPFGERLAALRKARGWTQPDLAAKLGTTVQMVTYYERRAKNPSAELVLKIADVFKVGVNELFGTECKVQRKPGPASRLEEITEQLSGLPRNKQKVVVEMLEGFLQKTGAGHKQAA
jgi:transcriptional regulator with XRE-family HTH domain